MDGADIFKSGLMQATAVIKQVRPEHFANATPDSEWNARDLIEHMLYELSWVPDVLSGKTGDDVGTKYDGDLIGDDLELSADWQAAADKAERASDEVDPDETVHVSYGDISTDDYLYDEGTDQFIHAWDLAKSIGVPIHFDATAAQAIYDHVLPRQENMKASGLFAPPLTVSDDADISTKLLALFGRDSGWQRP